MYTSQLKRILKPRTSGILIKKIVTLHRVWRDADGLHEGHLRLVCVA
jgi:hypothetical protein